MSEFTVQLFWRLGRAEDLRAGGAAAIRADLGPWRAGLSDLFREFGSLALAGAQDGDEVWSWSPAEWCLEGCGIGLALVRGNEIVGDWP